MVKIKNMGFSQITISTAKDKTITLPGRCSKDISEEDFKTPECQRLFASHDIIVLPEGRQKPAVSAED